MKCVHEVVFTEGKRNIIQQLRQEYDIETTEGFVSDMIDKILPSDWRLAESSIRWGIFDTLHGCYSLFFVRDEGVI